ncbi:Spore cortex-lytic enzyme precursor [Tsuneonella dongtanensis]|uniref:Spore cortex-lytic enzyme n=1 Tax=Tsuneonella dongtanensis TaxID=692370 RepID=A0A1B2AA38_9SPHN|nr:cell wall hydrolase [Tsuneonella dongtanensis]ANY19027.1 Spore cortex-lytic enzyme precursor [Tsuneonella dongtanensis]
MQFHRSTIAALAATVVLTLFTADGSGANADSSEILRTEAQASPSTSELTDETVPAQFVSEEVVQPLPATKEADEASRADSLHELVSTMPRPAALSREMECLAGAIYFESRGEPLAGQLAVGQVVVNRAASGKFPSDYCGVVYQKSQFSFVRGGKMPRIDRNSAAWGRATVVAKIAHEGLWDSEVRDALFFHANYVKPRWSRTKVARATIDSHIFYR